MNQRKRVAVIGATGIAGQQFLDALVDHPWFEVTALAASPRSAGKAYCDAIRQPSGAMAWWCEKPCDPNFLEMTVQDAATLDPEAFDLIFTAVESDAARELEPRFAAHVPVFSTASAFRREPDVPLILPGVNNHHLPLVQRQRQERGWKGFVLPIPNCTTTGLAIALKPLQAAFGLDLVVMTSIQAVSGAGRHGGVLAMDVIDNLIPYIPKEEEKVQWETQKILGELVGNQIRPNDARITCTCTRAAVIDAHFETVAVSLRRPAEVAEARAAMEALGTDLEGLPSAPEQLIFVHDDPFRPQPRLDRNRGDGMVTTVGRLRNDEALENGLKFVLVSHNTRMGAARGAMLLAELTIREGLLEA
jgi:aspartate-semialdehyde dehydrogenase